MHLLFSTIVRPVLHKVCSTVQLVHFDFGVSVRRGSAWLRDGMGFDHRADLVLSFAPVSEHGLHAVMAVREDREVRERPLNRCGVEGVYALPRVKHILVDSEP